MNNLADQNEDKNTHFKANAHSVHILSSPSLQLADIYYAFSFLNILFKITK